MVTFDCENLTPDRKTPSWAQPYMGFGRDTDSMD